MKTSSFPSTQAAWAAAVLALFLVAGAATLLPARQAQATAGGFASSGWAAPRPDWQTAHQASWVDLEASAPLPAAAARDEAPSLFAAYQPPAR